MTDHRPPADTDADADADPDDADPDEVDLRLLCALRADGRARTAVRKRPPIDGASPTEGDPRALNRPLQALARVKYGPVPLDFDQLAARIPAVQWGLTLAGDADLELHLACVDHRELREIVAALRRAGAARIQVELVLRRLVPGAVPLPAATMARSAVA